MNFQERKGENELASIASNMLENINKKYKEYNITQEAYVVVKANAGTYGMGIMIIKNSEDVLNLNRKMRKKMSVIKGGGVITEVIIQEGIHLSACSFFLSLNLILLTFSHFVNKQPSFISMTWFFSNSVNVIGISSI